jgi:hypothetical protein
VQTRPTCHPDRFVSSKTVGAGAKHEDVTLFAACNVHVTVGTNREDSGVAYVLSKLLDTKPSQHMKLRNLWRWKLYRLENMPGNFDIGMMLKGAACGGWSLRFHEDARRDQNREDTKAHVAFACNWSAMDTHEASAL